MPNRSMGAYIKPDGIPGQKVYSKYVVACVRVDPITEIDETIAFNINSDVTVPAFHSLGADKAREDHNLTCEYQSSEDLTGFDQFTGAIGGGRIHIATTKGVIIKGKIVGGPTSGQSFVGSGTWLRS